MADKPTPIPTEKPNSEQSPTKRLLSLSDILLSLGEVFRFNMTERAMAAYTLTVGHRTDRDLNKAYRQVLRTAKFMPTPERLLEECGELKVRRDGTRNDD